MDRFPMVKDKFIKRFCLICKNTGYYFYKLLFSVFTGIAAGGTGIAFYHCISFATRQRNLHPWLLFLLPVGGLVIVFLYQIAGEENNKGTNLVLLAIHEDADIPPVIAPLMFISTMITHLFGGSAGREGAALQIGGSIGSLIGNIFHFDNHTIHLFVMCGMSACFSAVFGTPLAAAVFSMEVFCVGIMHYGALFPCMISSYTAYILSQYLHAPAERYHIPYLPSYTFLSAGKILIFALVIAAASILFCLCLHQAGHLFQKYFKNPYLRVIVGGLSVIVLVYVFQTRDYLGSGTLIIDQCFEEGVPWYSFILKVLFTAITLGAGFKGGEIVPSFFTGATLGCVIAPLFGLPAPLCAACGMIGLFCGVTNCPLTSLFIAIELFGIGAMPFYAITIAACYMMSGYFSLYTTQQVYFSKFHDKVINHNK